MPLDKLVLILVVVIGAGAVTVWLGVLVASAVQFPFGWFAAIPAVLAAYLAWRVISDRLRNAEDDHYDRIEK
jgi:membrane protein implicated in regulation of membrane protease activity